MNIWQNIDGTARSTGEVCFGFTDCAPVPQGPQMTVPAREPEGASVSVSSDRSDWSDSPDKAAGYTILRNFRGWITVTAAWFRRKVAVLFSRLPEIRMPRRVRVLAYAGGLRL